MAENAVNISSIHHKSPNIFELVAQESLGTRFYPALKTIYYYIATKYNWSIKWYEEIFLGTDFLLQYYYLKVFNSSFSETFYGLRRIPSLSENPKGKLPSKTIAVSLFFLVGIPYANRKLNSAIHHYEESRHCRNINHKKLEALAKLQKITYSAYGILKFCYLMSYVASYSNVHDPVLKMSGVKLIYQNRELPNWRDIWKELFQSKDRTPKLTMKVFLKLMASSLEMGAFFIQFLHWWHSDESKASMNKLPIPKPPHLNNGSDLCPICHQKRKNEVVLQTSGYVFCYLCIKNYLDQKAMCPITNLPSSGDCLVRIYSNDV